MLAPRTGALEVASDGDAVISAVDERTLQALLLGPADLLETAVEREGVIAVVARTSDLGRRHGRELVGHVDFADQITAPELDPVDAQIQRHEIEQPLAEEVGFKAAWTAVGSARRF